MSDQYIGQKMIEEEELAHFLEAYEEITGQALEVVEGAESPDFICRRPTGELVGVELTRSPHDYQMAQRDRIWAESMAMDTYSLLEAIHRIVAKKAKKRALSGWRLPENAMLVVKLVDYSFGSLRWFSEKRLATDFAAAGFAEIWVADHTEIDAYGTARLIGLYPEEVWGTHYQDAFYRKPYG
ncbi:MAG TPA: hypothetical protein VNZ64_08230 [Candidatus Acidoferrum sp.]|jgi:hypothetical protein|nr:hypothetical protein [Candidatus Acidoferrum sp.]